MKCSPRQRGGRNNRRLETYLASPNATQMGAHVDLRNDVKKFTCFLWEDVIVRIDAAGTRHAARADLRRRLIQEDLADAAPSPQSPCL